MMSKVHDAFNKWLSLPSTEAIDVIAATVVGNRLDGPPIFMVVVGPSGSGKSELIDSLTGLSNVKAIGKFTPRTLASGYRNKNGLLEKLPPNVPTVLTIKDLTTVLSMHHNDRDQIMSQLREIYDGRFDCDWGTGKHFTWIGKVGIIAGCTMMYDEVAGKFSGLGERFLAYKPSAADPIMVAEKAMRGSNDEKQLKFDLKQAFKQLDKLTLPKVVRISSEIRQYLAELCEFLANARAAVPRDRYGNIVDLPSPEATGRVAKQFAQLAKGLAVVRGEKSPTEDEVVTLEHVAFSSIPRTRFEVITALPWDGASIRDLERCLGIPRSVIHRALEDMVLLGITELATTYRPSERYAKFVNSMRKCHIRMTLESEGMQL